MDKRIIDRTGEVGISNQGMKMKIIKYNTGKNIDVEFENGYVANKVTYYDFKKGSIWNPLIPSVYGVGFVGIGEYLTRKNNKYTEEYLTWQSMFVRCYSDLHLQKNPTYVRCLVCEEWHDFQNFARWYKDNYVKYGDGVMNLDKDIFEKGNKIYSPSTCFFVDRKINCLFTNRKALRGDCPIGVCLHKKHNMYYASVKIEGNIKKHIGSYKTKEDAFLAYKKAKENYIKEVADDYRQKYENFPDKLYQAMYRWEVEITD